MINNSETVDLEQTVDQRPDDELFGLEQSETLCNSAEREVAAWTGHLMAHRSK